MKPIKDHRWINLVDQDVFIRKSAIIRITPMKHEVGVVLDLETGAKHAIRGLTPEDFFVEFLQDFGLSPEELLGHE